MDGLILFSEVARNLALPAIGVLGAWITLWQAMMTKRRAGFDLIAKAVNLYSADDPVRRLGAYALLIEAIGNGQSRGMASRMFGPYIIWETDVEVLRNCLRLAAGSSAIELVDWRLAMVSPDEGSS